MEFTFYLIFKTHKKVALNVQHKTGNLVKQNWINYYNFERILYEFMSARAGIIKNVWSKEKIKY